MQDQLLGLLPSDETCDAMVRETGNGSAFYAEMMQRLGLGFTLMHLTQVLLYPTRWWGSPKWPEIVERYCTLEPPPPDPATFRERMLMAPWELSDEQARFVTDHRYSI